MPRIVSVNGLTPAVDPQAFVADTAVVAGDVSLAAGASVWFGAVLRAEKAPVRVGADSNLQDLTVVHTDAGFPVTIGERVTVGHRAVIHGCTIEDDVLIGMGAVVMNGAVIGRGAIVGAGAVVTESTEVPPGSLAVGLPAKVLDRDLPAPPFPNVANYLELVRLYRDAEVADH